MAVGQGNSIAGLIYDRPEALRSSYPRLSSYFSKQIGQPPQTTRASASPAAPNLATWTRQTGGDRSTTVLLPPNWKLTAVASGSVGVDGPSKEQVVLGYQIFVTPGTPTYVPYMDPEQALGWFTRTQGVQLVRTIDHADAHQMNPSGQAEFMTVEVQHADGSKYKSLTLVMTNPMAMNIWKFYISYIAVPEEQFDAAYPTMWGIWKNWKLDPGYVQDSLARAAATEAETRRMVMEGALRSMHAFDDINEAWDETIRGVSTMEETGSGARIETPIGEEGDFIHACQNRGITCREVPIDELIPQE